MTVVGRRHLGSGFAGATLWLVLSLLLHVPAGFLMVHAVSSAGGADERPAAPPLLADREIGLGSPTMRIASLTWLGAPDDTGAAGAIARTAQAQQDTPAPALTDEQGGRALGELREPAERLSAAVQQATGAVRRGVESVAGLLFRAGTRDGRDDNDAEGEAAAAASADPAPRASGEEGTASRTSGQSTTDQARSDTGRDGADDREAPATRLLVAADNLGDPIEAFGLRIRTRAPTFSLVTEIRARFRNPRVTLDFDGNGVVQNVQFAVRSGHRDIDADLENALWAWRAVPLEQARDEGSTSASRPRRVLPASLDFEIGLRPGP